MNILSLVRKNIKNLKPYSTARDEFKGVAEVYLDANENPFPSNYNRYPDPLQRKLKKKIADLKSVKPEQIFLGNGSDEAVDLIIRVFCEPKENSILITYPTYGMYAVSAAVNDVPVKKALLTNNYNLDLDSINAQLDDSVKIIFLCSPNNPSGNLQPKEKIREVIKTSNRIVVLDEAYIEFSGDQGFLPELSSSPNLIVLHTFSKAWGLAGLRLGMAFASPEIISVLNKIKPPYNINMATQQIALEKLNGPQRTSEHVKIILEERTRLEEKLKEFSFVELVHPSDANFILVKMGEAKTVYNYLTDKSIIVRDRSSVALCENCLRITVGTPDENKKLIEALKQFK